MAKLTEQRERSPSAIRSAQMIQCLRQSLLYAEKRARDALFPVIPQILEEHRSMGAAIRLSKLTRDAAAVARARNDNLQDVNWEVASKALINAMLRAGVLIAPDGSPVGDGVGAQASQVADVKAGLVEITEAYMLQFLIRKLGDVCTRDHKALAHALFRQFDSQVPMHDMEDRVMMLLATLTGSVSVDDDGSYYVRPLSAMQQGFAAAC
jgi:hypothetical protein